MATIKKTLLIISALCITASCSSKNDNNAKSAGEVIDTYRNTLVQSPERARKAAQSVGDKANAEEKQIKELDEGSR